MRLFLSLLLFLVMISNALVSWSVDFLGAIEKIELSELVDGEVEDTEEKTEKEKDTKIKYNYNIKFSNSLNTHLNSWKSCNAISINYYDVVTPPPELV